MKKIAVFTSGGDSPGMNACIRAVVRTAIHFGLEAVGVYRGYQGLIDADFKSMPSHSVSNILQQGGTILRSARCDDFFSKEGRKKAYDNLKKEGIDGIVAIGGDGTFTGADVFLKEYPDIKIVGCPGTIDNDLSGTDYTIGYDTAKNTAMEAIDNIKDTANAHDRLFFVEVMGRDAGYIALNAGLSTGAEIVMIPEHVSSVDDLLNELENCFQSKRTSSIVVIAEGDELGGAQDIADMVKEKYDRYEMRVSILGHIQRGGRPSCTDRVRASRIGVQAVKALLAGENGVMVGLKNDMISFTPFEKAIKSQEPINGEFLEAVNILSKVI